MNGGNGMTDRVNHVLEYSRRGWYVFPLHYIFDGNCSCGNPDCKNIGKHPMTKNGLNDSTRDEEQIKRWWSDNPSANIGISTGPSGLVVIDIDPRDGGKESFEEFLKTQPQKQNQLQPLSVRTGGGGGHLYYLGNIQSRDGWLKGVDIKSIGGYVVAPPSNHKSGNSYSWINNNQPIDFPFKIDEQKVDFKPLPDIIPSGERTPCPYTHLRFATVTGTWYG